MSGGSLHLVDHCDVERYTQSASGQGYGRKRVPAVHLSNVSCRLVTKTRRGFNSVTGEWLVTTEYKLLALHGADIEEGDRITSVVLQDGTLSQLDFEVDGGSIPHRGHMAWHKTLMLRRVT